jgi:hypothetical protein
VLLISTHSKSKNQENILWLFITVCLLLSSNFMTTSFRHYVPLCLDMRHYLFLIPFFAQSAALSFADTKIEFRKSWISIIVSVLLCIFSFACSENNFYIYLISLIVLLARVFYNENLAIKAAGFLIVLLMTIKCYGFINEHKAINYNSYKQFFGEVVHPLSNNTLVVTDPVGKFIGDYLNQYDKNCCRIISYAEFNFDSVYAFDSILILHHSATSTISGFQWEDLPHYIQTPNNRMIPLAKNKEYLIWHLK